MARPDFVKTEFSLPWNTDYADRLIKVGKCGAALFTVTHRFTLAHRELFESCLTEEKDPKEIAANLKTIVTQIRPELAGCEVVGLHYDIFSQQWEICVVHESLPGNKRGERMEPQPLFPETWRDREPLL